jgi:hypothetical protein
MSAIGVIADIANGRRNARFWAKEGNGGFWLAMICPLMTQSGHSGLIRRMIDEDGTLFAVLI